MSKILDLPDHLVHGRYTYAKKWRRLLNYLIDGFFYLMSVGFLTMGINTLLSFDIIRETVRYGGGSFMVLAYYAIVYVLYYLIQEYFFRGKTIGKLITNTRAIDENGAAITLSQTAKRSISRLLPFEPVSFIIGSPIGIHDGWADTKVIVDIGWKDYGSD